MRLDSRFYQKVSGWLTVFFFYTLTFYLSDIDRGLLATSIFIIFPFLILFSESKNFLYYSAQILFLTNLVFVDILALNALGIIGLLNLGGKRKVDTGDFLEISSQLYILLFTVLSIVWSGGLSLESLSIEIKENKTLLTLFVFLIFLPFVRILFDREKLSALKIVKWIGIVQTYFLYIAYKIQITDLIKTNDTGFIILVISVLMFLLFLRQERDQKEDFGLPLIICFNHLLVFLGLFYSDISFNYMILANNSVMLFYVLQSTFLRKLSSVFLIFLVALVPLTPWIYLKKDIANSMNFNEFNILFLSLIVWAGLRYRQDLLAIPSLVKSLRH